MFYRVYRAEEAAAIQVMSASEKRKVARDIRDNAFGCHNPYFSWDKANGVATGSGAELRIEYYAELMPGTDYVLAYVGRNGFGTLTDLKFTDVFTTDERNLTTPANFDSDDFRVTLDKPGRTSFRQNFTFDLSKVSMIHFQYMTVDGNPGLWVDDSWEDWVNWVFTVGMYGTQDNPGPQINTWAASAIADEPTYTWTGMTPDTEYYVFACAEDFDGNVTPMQFVHINTSELQIGPDPTVNMTLTPSRNNPDGWTMTYEIDHDVEYFLYCYTKEPADLAMHMPGVNKADFNNIKESKFGYEDWYNGIYEWVAGGFEENGGGMKAQSDTSQDWTGSDVVIAACIAVGHDGTAPVYKMYHLICKDGKAQTLEEIFGITE
jgi:hypothetical protein